MSGLHYCEITPYFWLDLGYVWAMYGLCMGYVWAMYGLCMGYVLGQIRVIFVNLG